MSWLSLPEDYGIFNKRPRKRKCKISRIWDCAQDFNFTSGADFSRQRCGIEINQSEGFACQLKCINCRRSKISTLPEIGFGFVLHSFFNVGLTFPAHWGPKTNPCCCKTFHLWRTISYFSPHIVVQLDAGVAFFLVWWPISSFASLLGKIWWDTEIYCVTRTPKNAIQCNLATQLGKPMQTKAEHGRVWHTMVGHGRPR